MGKSVVDDVLAALASAFTGASTDATRVAFLSEAGIPTEDRPDPTDFPRLMSIAESVVGRKSYITNGKLILTHCVEGAKHAAGWTVDYKALPKVTPTDTQSVVESSPPVVERVAVADIPTYSVMSYDVTGDTEEELKLVARAIRLVKALTIKSAPSRKGSVFVLPVEAHIPTGSADPTQEGFDLIQSAVAKAGMAESKARVVEGMAFADFDEETRLAIWRTVREFGGDIAQYLPDGLQVRMPKGEDYESLTQALSTRHGVEVVPGSRAVFSPTETYLNFSKTDHPVPALDEGHKKVDDAIQQAKRQAADLKADRYVFATAYGYAVWDSPPPKGQKYYIVSPQGKVSLQEAAPSAAPALDQGLKGWVRDYIQARHSGNLALAKSIKANLDREIKKQGLDAHDVYFAFGDPNDPKTRQEVLQKVAET